MQGLSRLEKLCLEVAVSETMRACSVSEKLIGREKASVEMMLATTLVMACLCYGDESSTSEEAIAQTKKILLGVSEKKVSHMAVDEACWNIAAEIVDLARGLSKGLREEILQTAKR